jgi:tetratricopeptide (TPR) repeat protein
MSLVTGLMIGWSFYFARKYDEAYDQFSKLIELEPSFHVAHWGLGWVQDRQSKFPEAISSFKTASELSGGGTEIIGGLGHAYAVSGQLDEVEKLLIELQQRSEERYVSPYYQALIYVGLAESDPAHKDKTIELLERAYEDRFEWLVHLGVDPAFDWLVGEPRYDALLGRLGVS